MTDELGRTRRIFHNGILRYRKQLPSETNALPNFPNALLPLELASAPSSAGPTLSSTWTIRVADTPRYDRPTPVAERVADPFCSRFRTTSRAGRTLPVPDADPADEADLIPAPPPPPLHTTHRLAEGDHSSLPLPERSSAFRGDPQAVPEALVNLLNPVPSVAAPFLGPSLADDADDSDWIDAPPPPSPPPAPPPVAAPIQVFPAPTRKPGSPTKPGITFSHCWSGLSCSTSFNVFMQCIFKWCGSPPANACLPPFYSYSAAYFPRRPQNRVLPYPSTFLNYTAPSLSAPATLSPAIAAALHTVYDRRGFRVYSQNNPGMRAVDPFRAPLSNAVLWSSNLRTRIRVQFDAALAAADPTVRAAPSTPSGDPRRHPRRRLLTTPSMILPRLRRRCLDSLPPPPLQLLRLLPRSLSGAVDASADPQTRRSAAASSLGTAVDPWHAHRILQERCPACFGLETWGRPLSEGGDVQLGADGCFSYRHLKSAGDGPISYDPLVLHFQGEGRTMCERASMRPGRSPSANAVPMLPQAILDACEESFEAAHENKRKADPKYYDATGIFVISCRHSQVLFLCNIDTPGESQQYIVAAVEEVQSYLPPVATVLQDYDIGCIIDHSLNLFNILTPGLRPRVAFCINAMHAFGHQWVCQIVGVERFWSRIRKLIPLTRHQWNSRRIWLIDQYAAFVNEEGRDKLGPWLLRQQEKNLEPKLTAAKRILRQCRVPEAELRRKWAAQKVAQSSVRSYAPARVKRGLSKVLALQNQIDAIELSIQEVRTTIATTGKETRESRQILDRLERTHQTLNEQAELLIFPELKGLPLKFVHHLTTMRALKVDIRDRAIGTLFEAEALGKNHDAREGPQGTKLTQATKKAMARAPTPPSSATDAVSRSQCLFPPDLVELRDDPILHQDIWTEVTTGPLPRWLEDADVRDGIRSLHVASIYFFPSRSGSRSSTFYHYHGRRLFSRRQLPTPRAPAAAAAVAAIAESRPPGLATTAVRAPPRNGAATTSTRQPPAAAATHRRARAASQWRRNDFDAPICSIDGLQPHFRRQWRRNDFDAPICNIDGLQPRFRPVHAAYENDDEDYFDMPPTTAVRAPPRNDAATTPTAPLVPLSQQHAIYEDDDDDEDYFDVPPDPAASAADHMVALEELDPGLLSDPDQPLNVQDVLDAPAPQVSGVDKALLTFELYWDPPNNITADLSFLEDLQRYQQNSTEPTITIEMDDLDRLTTHRRRLNGCIINGVVAAALQSFCSLSLSPSCHIATQCAVLSTYDLHRIRFNATDAAVWKHTKTTSYWEKPDLHWVFVLAAVREQKLFFFDSLASNSGWRRDIIDVMLLIHRMVELANKHGHALHISTLEDLWEGSAAFHPWYGVPAPNHSYDCGAWVLCMMAAVMRGHFTTGVSEGDHEARTEPTCRPHPHSPRWS
ncbi:hypothetical protein B0H14DRAFT_3531594 [Mycena olivaceomarginata]|nr:hypothetical protein B0H14DRAFT_3531594 [Mycena olivaceomarginata]